MKFILENQRFLIKTRKRHRGIFFYYFVSKKKFIQHRSLKNNSVRTNNFSFVFSQPFFFFSIRVFFLDHSRNTGLQGEGEGISLTSHYHFHPLHRHLDISRAITAESSPLHMAGRRTRTGNLWFPSASRSK